MSFDTHSCILENVRGLLVVYKMALNNKDKRLTFVFGFYNEVTSMRVPPTEWPHWFSALMLRKPKRIWKGKKGFAIDSTNRFERKFEVYFYRQTATKKEKQMDLQFTETIWWGNTFPSSMSISIDHWIFVKNSISSPVTFSLK